MMRIAPHRPRAEASASPTGGVGDALARNVDGLVAGVAEDGVGAGVGVVVDTVGEFKSRSIVSSSVKMGTITCMKGVL